MYHSVQHNDIVILGTDGVFDNIHDEQIISECIKPNVMKNGDIPKPEDAASCISYLAESFSYSKTAETPWTKYCVENGMKKEENLGGK